MRLSHLARLALFSAVAVASSCTTYYPPPANIFLTWTFAGGSCASAPGVVSVTVNIPNDPVPISPNTFACSAGNPPNALAIYSFAPGSYVVNLTALDSTGAVIYAGSQTLVVNGLDVSATIDLQPVAPLLSWTFAPASGSAFPPCTTPSDPDPDRLDSVAVFADGNTTTPAAIYDCSAGSGGAQVVGPALGAGTHVLQLVGYQAGLLDSFAQTVPITVNFSTATSQAFTFQWLVGGVGVAWTYPDLNACTSGSVTSVSVTFSTPGYGLNGFACTAPVGVFKALPAVAADGSNGVSYSVGVSAYGSASGVPLYKGLVSPVTISPGVFYDGTTATVVTVPLAP